MAWKNGYLYRNKRVGKKVITEYLGTGYAALLTEQMNERVKAEAEAKRREWEALKDEQERLDKIVDDFGRLASAYADALLLTSGYRQHKRGEWRKKREHTG